MSDPRHEHSDQPHVTTASQQPRHRARRDYLPQLESLIGQRWDVYALSCLSSGPLRWGQLATAIRTAGPKIADSALTRCLHRLRTAALVVCDDDGAGAHTWALTRAGLAKANRLAAVLHALRDLEHTQRTTADPRAAPNNPRR